MGNPSSTNNLDKSDSDNILVTANNTNSNNNQQQQPQQHSYDNTMNNNMMNNNQSKSGWNCPLCTFENMPLLPYCKMCNTPKPNYNNNNNNKYNDDFEAQQPIYNVSHSMNQSPPNNHWNNNSNNNGNNNNDNNNYNKSGLIWCWQDDNAEYQAYPMNISQEIDRLNINGVYSMMNFNIPYEIKKVSYDACIQTNMQTDDVKLVVLQDINENNNNNYNGSSNNTSTYHWYWQHNQSYKPFNNDVSKKLDQLKIGDVYPMYIGGTKYEIKKTSQNAATQKNTKTNFERKVIRKAEGNDNQSDDYKNDDIERNYNNNNRNESVWCWEHNGSYKQYASNISKELNKLQIGESYTTKFGNTNYEITKISNDKCEQKNMKTDFKRNVILQSASSDNTNDYNESENSNNRWRHRNNNDHDEKKEAKKWYWKDDSGQFKSCGYNVSNKISKLAIGESKKEKIHNKWYEFKRTAVDKCDQKNSKTGTIREVRLAKYGWGYKNSDGEFIAYTDKVNKSLNTASIGGTVTFSIKNNKYSVTKQSWNSAQQMNVSSNTKRNIIRKMILNENTAGSNTIDKNKVKELFHATCPKSKYSIIEVQDLTHTMNAIIYEKIIQEKCKKGRKRDKTERYLWHGTKNLDNLELIKKNGFDRSFNTASAYGKGTYFARDASYSVGGGYCGKDTKGVSYILVCKVIVGDYAVGNSSVKTIPRKPDGSEYETLVNNKADPSIFVVWRDYHAVPCYLVKYK